MGIGHRGAMGMGGIRSLPRVGRKNAVFIGGFMGHTLF